MSDLLVGFPTFPTLGADQGLYKGIPLNDSDVYLDPPQILTQPPKHLGTIVELH